MRSKLVAITTRSVILAGARTPFGTLNAALAPQRRRSNPVATTTRSVILAGARTPFGKLNGALASLRAVDLGCHVLKAAIDRSGVAPGDIENVILGQVLQGGAGQ